MTERKALYSSDGPIMCELCRLKGIEEPATESYRPVRSPRSFMADVVTNAKTQRMGRKRVNMAYYLCQPCYLMATLHSAELRHKEQRDYRTDAHTGQGRLF